MFAVAASDFATVIGSIALLAPLVKAITAWHLSVLKLRNGPTRKTKKSAAESPVADEQAVIVRAVKSKTETVKSAPPSMIGTRFWVVYGSAIMIGGFAALVLMTKDNSPATAKHVASAAICIVAMIAGPTAALLALREAKDRIQKWREYLQELRKP